MHCKGARARGHFDAGGADVVGGGLMRQLGSPDPVDEMPCGQEEPVGYEKRSRADIVSLWWWRSERDRCAQALDAPVGRAKYRALDQRLRYAKRRIGELSRG